MRAVADRVHDRSPRLAKDDPRWAVWSAANATKHKLALNDPATVVRKGGWAEFRPGHGGALFLTPSGQAIVDAMVCTKGRQ